MCNYVTKKYGQAMVVFYGYQAVPSTKDSTHRRRVGCQGYIYEATGFLLCWEINYAYLEVQHATSDADLLIVQTAVTHAGYCEAVLVGDETDLQVFILYHAGGNKHDIYFRPEPKGGTILKCLTVNSVRGILGEIVCKNIPFVHAFLGCEGNISRVFGVGKAAGLKLIKDNQQFHSQAET